MQKKEKKKEPNKHSLSIDIGLKNFDTAMKNLKMRKVIVRNQFWITMHKGILLRMILCTRQDEFIEKLNTNEIKWEQSFKCTFFFKLPLLFFFSQIFLKLTFISWQSSLRCKIQWGGNDNLKWRSYIFSICNKTKKITWTWFRINW